MVVLKVFGSSKELLNRSLYLFSIRSNRTFLNFDIISVKSSLLCFVLLKIFFHFVANLYDVLRFYLFYIFYAWYVIALLHLVGVF